MVGFIQSSFEFSRAAISSTSAELCGGQTAALTPWCAWLSGGGVGGQPAPPPGFTGSVDDTWQGVLEPQPGWLRPTRYKVSAALSDHNSNEVTVMRR